MATTTNYGWTTPDDTALVKDGAAAIRTLGSSVDTTTKALNPSTTLGDIEYRSSTANTNTRLGIGSTGQVLTVAGGVPSWATPAGGGKVLQVVGATNTTNATTTSATYVTTGFTNTITPSSASSKVLVEFNFQYRSTAANTSTITVFRGNIATGTNLGSTTGFAGFYANDLDKSSPAAISFLDSPATTSAVTYTLAMKTDSGGTLTFNQHDVKATSTLLEIGA